MLALNLKSKLIAVFLVVGVLPFTVMGIISLWQSNKALKEQALAQMETARENKKFQIENLFSKSFRDVQHIASLENVQNYFAEFDNIGSSEGFDAADYKEASKDYTPILNSYSEGYANLFLMSVKGSVVYTLNKDSAFGTNLVNGKYKNTGLSRAFIRAVKGKNVFEDFTRYAPLKNAPASFIAAPLKNDSGSVIGVLALQIPVDSFNKIMTQRAGMGESGETYLVGPDNLMRSDSHEGNTNHSVAASFANPETGKMHTDAVRYALSGEIASGEIASHGNSVLSAYTPLKAGENTWALIAEMDSDEALAAVKDIKLIMLIFAVIGIAAIIGVALLFTRAITDPIAKSVTFAKNMSKGDFTLTLDIDRNDEIGILAGALNDMVSNLGQMIRDIIAGAETMKASSDKQLAIVNDLNEGISKQTGQTEQAAVSITEMAQTIMEIAQNASDASNASKNASKTARDGEKVVQQTATGMMKISETVSGLASTIDELGRNSDEINNIISVIDDIADQTNLLALNAAIEAARAGDQGRGFAVVADEVRKLAERTSKSTKEIADMIKKTQDNTKISIKGMETGKEEVESGVGFVEHSKEVLIQIVNVSEQSMEMVQRIAAAAEEQSIASEQISANMEDITSVAKHSARSTLEIKNAAEDVERTTLDLIRIVSLFKLKKQKINRPYNINGTESEHSSVTS